MGFPLFSPRVARARAGGGMNKVSLRFNWTAKGEFTPFFVARELGFFREEHLDVELSEGKSGTQAVQVVGAGSDHFGYVPSIQVIQGINQGIPIKTVGTFGKATGMCWASWPEVPLNGPKALEGRKVSISSQSTFFQVWPAFARAFQVDSSKVEVVSADPAARVGLFLSRRVEIMADIFLANDYVIIQSKAGKKLNLLKVSELGFDPLGYLLIAKQSLLKKEPELVRRFLKATLKGFVHTVDRTREAIEIMTRLYGDRLGAEVIEGQVTQLLTLINREPALGASAADAWRKSLGLLHESGVIDKKLALEEYFTNEFVSA
ncbi:MAG TPA: ABC transporter substrate-binding protein [Myxococcaceae bacterium]|nr:ABC transporter substrate-binding protein [Myxococcaceae bacterium]